MKYYVYILKDPRTDLPVYVGKGSYNRLNYHWCVFNKLGEHPENFKLTSLFLELKKIGLEIVTEKIYETNNEKEAYLVEREIQVGYEDLGYELCNLCECGRPTPIMYGDKNPMRRPEVVAKFRGDNHPNKRPEEREKQRIAQKKRYEDPREREKTSLGQKKRYEDPREREKTGQSRAGEKCNFSKITEKIVKYIRQNPDNMKATELAKKFNISWSNVYMIKRGDSWKHVKK